MPQLDAISSDTLPASVADLINAAPLPHLDGSPHSAPTAEAIQRLIAAGELKEDLATSGLWLLAGELDASHSISQAVHSRDGSYWHGIMHRREGDFWNAKYWFRKAGAHPVEAGLREWLSSNPETLADSDLPLAKLASSNTIASDIVDLCEQAQGGTDSWVKPLEAICWHEWQLLFRACSRSS